MTDRQRTQATPRYQQIKENLLARISAGEWTTDEAIPPEETLAREFSVARMTVNRALRELTDSGVLRRERGSGTYVAPPRVETSLLEIRNIADEIASRGHVHRSDVHRLEPANITPELAGEFALEAGIALFHSVLVHCENGTPIQVEDRWVNPVVVPDYLAQDFTRQTPNAYLSSVSPLTRATYSVEARLPDPDIASKLKIGRRTPCLVVHRTTWTGNTLVSVAQLWHPGERYRLRGGL